MATHAVSRVASLLIGFLLSCDLIIEVSGWSEHAEQSSHRIQVVDNDPEFLVGARGMDKPFCFHLESPENDVIRLLQDPVSGIVVNARVFHDRHTNKSYLGTILMSGTDIWLLFRQNDLLINERKFQWMGMNAMDVRGHRVVVGANVVAVTFRKKKITLVVRRHFVAKDSNDDTIDNETTSHESEESESGVEEEEAMAFDNGSDSDGNKDRGDSVRRKRGAWHNNSQLKQKKNNFSAKSSHILKAIGTTKDAENGMIELMSKRSLSRHHNKRHGSGSHHRRHKKLRGKRYESSPFRPDEADRLRRVPSYNDVTQSDPSAPVQSAVGRTVYLGLYILDSRGFSNNTHGLLGQFLFKNVTIERVHYKNGRMKAKFLIDQNPPRRTIALLSLRKNVAHNTTRACWRVRHQGRDLIDGGYRNYVVPDMRDTSMMQLPPIVSKPLPRPVTPVPWPGAPITTTLSNQDGLSPSSSSSTTPAPPTYPTCVYETHHRVEPIAGKTNPNINPFFIATSNDKTRFNMKPFGNNNNNDDIDNKVPTRVANNRNNWLAGARQGNGGAGTRNNT